jgi:hypothetical protein
MNASDLHPLVPRGRFTPLREAAEITGWSERSLLDDCRAGRIDHVHRRGVYSFLPEQFHALLTEHVFTAVNEAKTAAQREVDELELARKANAERTARRGRGRPAA